MFFHRFKTQPTFIGNLLIALPIAHQTRQILFSARKPDQMRQGSAASLMSRCAALAQILELARRGADARFRELLDELNMLTLSFHPFA